MFFVKAEHYFLSKPFPVVAYKDFEKGSDFFYQGSDRLGLSIEEGGQGSSKDLTPHLVEENTVVLNCGKKAEKVKVGDNVKVREINSKRDKALESIC